MLGSNVDIMSPQWTNVIFKDRNQAYGAYQLRKQNANNTNRALFIAISMFLLAIAIPTLINKMHAAVPVNGLPLQSAIDVNIEPPVIIKENKIIPPAPQKQVQTQHNMIADKPPVVTADGHETPPSEMQLKYADPGPQTLSGHDGVAPVIDEHVGETTAPGVAEAVNDNTTFVAVEIQPVFPGGEAAFRKFLTDHIRYPEVAKENNVQGRVFLQFVVEKDGSLTDMKIVRDPGSGLGDEAARVLKTSPRWKPGIQNNKPVRVQFTVPVNFSLAE